jgi:hypothetical protein
MTVSKPASPAEAGFLFKIGQKIWFFVYKAKISTQSKKNC